MSKQHISGRIAFVKRATPSGKKKPMYKEGDPRYVAGFASMTGEDRQGDDIDPELFDIKSFMTNPQLFYNHKLWKTSDGNEVSVGVVEEMVVAVVAASENDDEFKIVSKDTGELIDTVPKDDRRVIEEGDVGLWVKARVMEPGVIQMIDEGRLNAFSWRGDMSRKNATPKIDLMEVSLVYVPANSRSLVYSKSLEDNTQRYVVMEKGGGYKEIAVGADDPAFLLSDQNIRTSSEGPAFAYLKEFKDGTQEFKDLRAEEFQGAIQEFWSYVSEHPVFGRIVLLKNTYKASDEGPVFEVLDEAQRRYVSTTNFWTQSYVDGLPDGAFAYVEKGGDLDEQNMTAPRSLRHFPIKDHRGSLDRGRVEDAINALEQHPFACHVAPVLKSAADELGIKLPETLVKGGDTEVSEEMKELGGKIDSLIAGFGTLLEPLKELVSKKAEVPAAPPVEEAPKAPEVAVAKSEEPTTPNPMFQELVAEFRGLRTAIESLTKAEEPAETKTKSMPDKAVTDVETMTKSEDAAPLTDEQKANALDAIMATMFTPERHAVGVFTDDSAF